MALALQKQQLLALFLLIVLAFLTVLILSFVVLSAVAHINVWHAATSLVPMIMGGSH